MSKRTTKKAKPSPPSAGSPKPETQDARTAAQEPPPIRYPEHKGTPLRPDQFPTLEQAAQLAAVLAQGKAPQDDTAAAVLAQAVLRLWRVSRDEINLQRAQAEDFWIAMDSNAEGKAHFLQSIQARLERLGATGMMERKAVTWKEAASLLWKDAKPKEREANLSQLVSHHMTGKSAWKAWTLESFREYGFCTAITFPSLISIFDEQQKEAEKKERSATMAELGKKSAAKRQAKAKSEWGRLS